MSAADQIIPGERWCLRSIKLPYGTQEQVSAWVRADPRPNARVTIVKPPTAGNRDVHFLLDGTRELFRLPDMDFTERYQPVRGDPPMPEQVPPERPPESHQEFMNWRLAGW